MNGAVKQIIFANKGPRLTDPDCRNLVNIAIQKGYQLPSARNLELINQLFIDLKAASSTGTLSPYSDINVYATDIVHASGIPADLGFDGMKWNNPNVNVTRANTLTKIVKRGYTGNPSLTAYINKNVVPSTLGVPVNQIELATCHHFFVQQNGQNGAFQGLGQSLYTWRTISAQNAGVISGALVAVPSQPLGETHVAIGGSGGGRALSINGLIVATTPTALGPLPTVSMFDLALNQSGTPTSFYDSTTPVIYSLIYNNTQVNRLQAFNALKKYIDNVILI